MRTLRGVSFIDVIVGTALVLTVFLSLFGLLRASLLVSTIAKARAAATSTASSQMEYVRSLSYDAVGTVGGIPPGIVPQYATSSLDGYLFEVRTYIDYVDDPADGQGAADETGITTDYKRAKVSVSYILNGKRRDVTLVSSIAPPGLETSTGGGTLRINVVNASGVAVPGASVRVVNSATSPAIDVTAFSNVSGIVYLPGAATSTEYQIYVSKSGYSNAQTYLRDATNQNPTPGYLTVVKDQTTTGTFAIDVLSNLIVRTYSPVEQATTTDSFTDSSRIESTAGASVLGGAVVLAGTPGAYAGSGTAVSTAIAPTHLNRWDYLEPSVSAPAGTSARVVVLDSLGTPLPESVLPGNAAGFTSAISLVSVSTTTYPTLKLRAELSTSDANVTPSVDVWSVGYKRGPVPLPNIAFGLTGTKTRGSTGAGAPLYKTATTTTSGASGSIALSLEWDAYTFSISGYDVVDACGAPPYALSPGGTTESGLVLGTATANMLLVSVRDEAGAPVPGATVTLSRSAYSETVVTSACGTAYFGGRTSATDYAISVAKTGYTPLSLTGIAVSGKTFYAALIDIP